MIRYIQQKNIDRAKYDSCIEQAINSRIYAYSWYLDIVADHWDALVLNDYEAVMPLPWRQKYFIKYVYPPAWTQQLGVFSKNEIPESLILNFIKSIPKKFKKITIQFNSANKFEHKSSTERVNYILPLDKTYEEIYESYRKDRRKRLRGFLIENITVVDSLDFEELKSVFLTNYEKKIQMNLIDFSSLRNIFHIAKLNGSLMTKSVSINGKLISGLIAIKAVNRVVILFSATSDIGMSTNSFSAIIDSVIKENSETNSFIDFEGSMIPSIASFNKSFGARIEYYRCLTYNNLPFFIKIFKK
ncbi:MAG: hypothetical protein KBE41_02015 [Lutibacter sp.]|nr:hypothetical protein [Lutibacter sp.]MBP9600253.1 hypothetical protein [Lutibacter sp.]